MITCGNCQKHKASESWVGEGGVMAYAHGMAEFWCKCCVIKTQLEYARETAKRIVKLEKQLLKIKNKCK